jgi:hypothetical protein
MSATNGKPRGRPPFWSNSSSSAGKRGQLSWHLNGKGSALVRTPYEPGDERQGEWSCEQLRRMDNRFRARLLRAFKRGEENRESAAQAYVIPSRRLVELLAFPPPLW